MGVGMGNMVSLWLETQIFMLYLVNISNNIFQKLGLGMTDGADMLCGVKAMTTGDSLTTYPHMGGIQPRNSLRVVNPNRAAELNLNA